GTRPEAGASAAGVRNSKGSARAARRGMSVSSGGDILAPPRPPASHPHPDRMDLASLLRGLLGIVSILAIAYAFSSSRRHINWRTIGVGLALQLVFAVFILRGSAMGEA